MPTYNGISVTIQVDGRLIPEYQIDINEGTKEITCWIPSYAGKEFDIRINNLTNSVQSRVYVSLDGQQTNIRSLGPGERQVVDKCRPSPTTYRTFVFSSGQPVGKPPSYSFPDNNKQTSSLDDDELSPDALNVAGLGTVQVSVFEGKIILDPHPTPSRDYRNIRIPEKRMIPERGKKGVEQVVGLGPIRSRPMEKPVMRRHSFRKEGLRAKPEFSVAFLQAQGIVPPDQLRQENPPKTSRNRKHTGVDLSPMNRPARAPKTSTNQQTPHEVIRLDISDEEDVEKLWALRARIDQALAKKDPSVARIKKEVKAESKPAFLKGEVIDLT
ncbi:hypothetical protein NP233_g3888 [Leucocoprinus birnbaumii]|uniref:DUF7918 domain-containing protein n=1 Tax=Leucocoprinus birnbaumii TaxID=56174 RepID=A0AAD5VX57_9AGAR|nr:hypothetical protein NP233_g3888 [Leucocoprinus birnbaumii]